MKSELRRILNDKSGSNCVVGCLADSVISTKELIEAAAQSVDIDAWRAAWVLNHALDRNDADLIKYHSKLVAALPQARDGHQRELIRLLEKLDRYADEEVEGRLFGYCIDIWSDIDKIPSARITAFRLAMTYVDRYPELIEELQPLTTNEYLIALSSGIRHSYQKIIADRFD